MARYVRTIGQFNFFKQTPAPTLQNGVAIGDVWIDMGVSPVTLKVCTTMSPLTFSTFMSAGGYSGVTTPSYYLSAASSELPNAQVISFGPLATLLYSVVTGTTQQAAINTAYIANNSSTIVFTLPSTSSVGDTVKILGKGAGGFRINQNNNQKIHFGTIDTTTGVSGYIASTLQRDSIELICTEANTDFTVASCVGNFTII